MNRFSRVLARIGLLAAPLLALAAPQAQASTQPAAPTLASGEDVASLNASFRRALADAPSTPTAPTGLRSTLLAGDAAAPEPAGELVLAVADAQRSHHARMDSTLVRRGHRHPRPPPRRHHHHH